MVMVLILNDVRRFMTLLYPRGVWLIDIGGLRVALAGV